MYAALAVMLVAVAAFTVLAVRRTRGEGSRVHAQLESFAYLGAGALGLDAAAVVVLGLAGGTGGRPELLAMIGLFAFVIYLAVAFVVAEVLVAREASTVGQRRNRRRSASAVATAPVVAPAAPAPSNPIRAARRPER